MTEKCRLSQFADNTQSLLIAKNKEKVIQSTQIEANSVIEYFSINDLVNNEDKASLLYNSAGKGEKINLQIGGEEVKSKESDELLGLY